MVEPLPMNGSSTVPLPSGSDARTTCRMKACGLMLGWLAIARSRLGAGEDAMTSLKGTWRLSRRNPPVPWTRRFSATVRSLIGARKMPHGSECPRAMTDTSGNSPSAPLGRSPPRRVFTILVISPRFSRPACRRPRYMRSDSSGGVGNHQVAAGDEDAADQGAERLEVPGDPLRLLSVHRREPRDGLPVRATHRLRRAPVASRAVPFLGEVVGVELAHAEGRVGDHGLDAVGLAISQPLEGVGVLDLVSHSLSVGGSPSGSRGRRTRDDIVFPRHVSDQASRYNQPWVDHRVGRCRGLAASLPSGNESQFSPLDHDRVGERQSGRITRVEDLECVGRLAGTVDRDPHTNRHLAPLPVLYPHLLPEAHHGYLSCGSLAREEPGGGQLKNGVGVALFGRPIEPYEVLHNARREVVRTIRSSHKEPDHDVWVHGRANMVFDLDP